MDQIPIHLTETLLKELAVRANNIIMHGSYSGDHIHEASAVMQLCLDIHQALEKNE
jgi:hypothetical protein